MAERFVHRVRPRYAEVDVQGVVFNAHWLTYFDDAMTRFTEWLGFDVSTAFFRDFDVMLVHAEIDWRGAAGFDDPVDITVAPVRLGGSSFDLRFEAAVGESPVCEATITYVSIEPGTHGSRPIPDVLRDALERAAPSGPTS